MKRILLPITGVMFGVVTLHSAISDTAAPLQTTQSTELRGYHGHAAHHRHVPRGSQDLAYFTLSGCGLSPISSLCAGFRRVATGQHRVLITL